MRSEPLTVSLESPGRPPVVVTFKGRTAAGIRQTAERDGIPEGEAVHRLLVDGLRIVERRSTAGRPKM